MGEKLAPRHEPRYDALRMNRDPMETAEQKIPPELIRAAIAGELLIVVGVGLPPWDELFEAMLQQAIEEPRDAMESQALLDVRDEWQQPRSGGWDWPAKKQFLIQILGNSKVGDFITSRIRTGQPETIHEVLANLHDCAMFVNLAGDGRLELALNEKRGKGTSLVLMRQNQFPDKPGAIVTLHDIGADVNGLWLAGDYELARFWSKLRPRTSAALVVGFGAEEDPSAIGAITYGGGGWYWLVEEGKLRSIQAERRGLQPIWIRDTAEMVSWLRAFASEVERSRAVGNSAMRVQVELPRATFDSIAANVAERFVKQQHRQQGAWTLYKEGQLSFEALCAETKLSPFYVVERFFQEMQREPGPMSPPVEVGRDAPPVLDGLHILTSALELALLQRFGLLEALLEGIGPNGSILLFEDVGRPLLEMVAPPEAALEMSNALQLGFAVQKALRAGMERGRVELITRPAVEDLPALKELPGMPEEKRREIEGRRFWWQKALGYLDALEGHSERRLLSADYFVTNLPESDFDLWSVLEWNEHANAFLTKHREANDHVLCVPSMVRSLVPTLESRYEHIINLARLGFGDALGRDELVAIARIGFDDPMVQSALDGASHMARTKAHWGAPLAQIQMAIDYSNAIWLTYTRETTWTPAEREVFLGRLLERAEQLDNECGTAVVDNLLMLLLGQSISHPSFSFVPAPNDDGRLQASTESAAGRLCNDLSRWTGPEGKRGAAFGRAARYACLLLDQFTYPGGPTPGKFAPLLLVIRTSTRQSLFEPLRHATAILSALWNNKPLHHEPLRFKVSEKEFAPLNYEEVLDAAGQTAITARDKIAISEMFCSFRHRIPGANGPVEHKLFLPIEAVMLRLPPTKRVDMARQLASLQGPLDGRAYEYLRDLAKSPDKLALWRDYARMTVTAPWRLIREDPALIRTWQSRAPQEGVFPNDLNDLQRILSEPMGAFPETITLIEQIVSRRQPGGCWAVRIDQDALFRLALEIAGSVSYLLIPRRFQSKDDDYRKEIELSLQHLRTPNDFTTGQICADLYFLRYAAAHRPLVKLPDREVDLRDELPQILGEVLRATLNPADKSLAKIEDALIRLCGQVVGQLAPFGQVEPRLGTWLSHRLFRWLWAQLETLSADARLAGLDALHKFAPAPQRIPGDDLLHPRRIDRNRHDFRLASVLLAFSSMDDLARKHMPPEENGRPADFRSASSPSIEAELVKLASKALNEDDYELRSLGNNASCLDWFGPATIPDLALNALLSLNSEKFFGLAPEVRMVWINDTPRNAEHAVTEELGERIWRTCERYARKLTDDEKTRLEAIARVDESFAPEQALSHRWSMFAALFLAGQAFLEDEVRTLLENNFADSFAPRAYGLYVAGLSVHAPERIETAAKAILAKVEATSIDPVSFALHLESATYSGKRVGIKYIQRVMLDCATKEPYKNNERFRIMMSAIGLSGRT